MDNALLHGIHLCLLKMNLDGHFDYFVDFDRYLDNLVDFDWHLMDLDALLNDLVNLEQLNGYFHQGSRS